MIFSDAMKIDIPEGSVKQIAANGKVIWKACNIPRAYQEVEWISAAANVGAYLKLGFAYDTGAVIRIGQWVMNDNTAYLFGAAENSGKLRCMISSPYNSNIIMYGTSRTSGTYTSIQLKYEIGALNDLTVTYKAGAWRAQNASIKGQNTSTYDILAEYTMTNELYLFAQNYNGSPRFGDERRISCFQYEDKDGNLVCDLVPCYRKSDGVVGMYDRARRLLLTNAGSGSFTKGANV